MDEKWRKELKYTMTKIESEIVAQRMAQFMARDSHAGRANSYFIRSVYFDNLYDKVLREKLDGVAVRDKFRIRFYNFNTGMIRLEKKSKRHDVGHKFQCILTKEETERILSGDIDWMIRDERGLVRELYLKIYLELFRPYVIVDYMREPLTYAPGNVRVTFDRDIRSSKDTAGFFDKALPTVPLFLDNQIVMEVKYDDYLPDLVSRTLLSVRNRERAFSKFAVSRSM